MNEFENFTIDRLPHLARLNGTWAEIQEIKKGQFIIKVVKGYQYLGFLVRHKDKGLRTFKNVGVAADLLKSTGFRRVQVLFFNELLEDV